MTMPALSYARPEPLCSGAAMFAASWCAAVFLLDVEGRLVILLVFMCFGRLMDGILLWKLFM